jgi:hypothetical protein
VSLDTLSIADTLISIAGIGIMNKNTNKTFSAPSSVEFRSVGTEILDRT